MKLKFLTIKKKTIIAFLLCFLAIGVFCVTYFTVKATNSPKAVHTIVIDAGHGGKDGGAVGDLSIESDLNLQYSLTLKDILEQFGFNVVLTRKDKAGLYNPLASNKKRSEMEKRKEIIEKNKPSMVISIHMNSFSSAKTRGAQVFYADGSECGKALAESVQKYFHKNLEYAKKSVQVGDYYILNCTQNPSILVECGFISNPEEEKLLIDENYRQKLCYNILCGVLMYYSKA